MNECPWIGDFIAKIELSNITYYVTMSTCINYLKKDHK